jgi:hypothetical protein
MAKTYDLKKSKTTGHWEWQCKDGSTGGSSTSKEIAKSKAKKACGNDFVISPPVVDLVAHRGYLSHFTVLNLDDKPVTFSTGEITESEFSFYFGLPCAKNDAISDERKAIVILKILGVYTGGQSIAQIKKSHNLTDKNFEKLIRKEFDNGELIIEDNGNLKWKF